MSTEKKRKEGTGHGVALQDRQKVEPPKNVPPTLTPSSTEDKITDDCLPNLSANIKPT